MLLLICSSFGALERLYFVVVAFPGLLHLYFYMNMQDTQEKQDIDMLDKCSSVIEKQSCI